MITKSANPDGYPTVWGLNPIELHDRFWSARGVQVVRRGQPSEVVKGAELFLLMAPDLLVIFRMRPLIDPLSWLRPDILFVRVRDAHERGFRERVITDTNGRFVRFARIYAGSGARLARVAMTPEADIARRWQMASGSGNAWRNLRHLVSPDVRVSRSVEGRTYNSQERGQVAEFMRELVKTWKRPDGTIERVRRVAPGVWADVESLVERSNSVVGAAWIGAGRELVADMNLITPTVLWDDPKARPTVRSVRWEELEPTDVFERPLPIRRPSRQRIVKRAFDLVFSLCALCVVVPFFPFIMLAIYIEDGRPLFFAHRRETVGGRVFPCLKFRSMRKNAEDLRMELASRNEVDGPQFFIRDDPRLTWVGRILRRYHLDELPQLLNVLVGDQSIVGPRPLPWEENQYCPAWRDARLSVKPGITGLWQIERTRRRGLDFQEWIKYDLEYIEKSSLWFDLKIVGRTIKAIIHR